MLQLAQGRRKAEAIGTPLYSPFRAARREGASLKIRQGQLAMIAAPPGCGKSFVIQFMLQKGDGQGNFNEGIYLSADSDPFTMYCRAASIADGVPQSMVEESVRNPEYASVVDSSVENATRHMFFDFRSDVSPEYLYELIAAYTTRKGKFPEFIVMDNLKNFNLSDEAVMDEFAAAEQSLVFLNEIAHVTGAAVIALHHVTGEYESAETCIPLGGIRGKLSKTPSAIYTMFRSDEGNLMVSTVKDRAGTADPRGRYMHDIQVDYDKGWMS